MRRILFISLCLLAIAGKQTAQSFELKTQTITVNGFTAEIQLPQGMLLEFVAAMNAPRFIEKGPDNEFIIGSRSGHIYRSVNPYNSAELLVDFGGYPHSTAYRNGVLYVAETAGVWAAPYQGAATQISAVDFTEVTPLPAQNLGHSSRTIVKGPDDRLYISLGISGNCSDEYLDNSYAFEDRRGGVYVLDNSNTLIPYSSGLRNPIGLAFHPQTNELYATNAGPDTLGYDNPPEVFTQLSDGSFHGMPWFQYYNGGFNADPCSETLTPPRPASDAVTPAALFLPRSTPQGIAFLPENWVGGQFAGSAIVAVHGSWATQPGAGAESRRHPKLTLVEFANNSPIGIIDMITGFQRGDGSRFARPSGVAMGADGNIYFTSDGGEVTGLFRLSIQPVQPRTTVIMLLMGVMSSQQEQ